MLASSVARWNDITRRLTLWVEILELNNQGQYMPVPVREQADVRTGGVYQLKQVRGRDRKKEQGGKEGEWERRKR